MVKSEPWIPLIARHFGRRCGGMLRQIRSRDVEAPAARRHRLQSIPPPAPTIFIVLRFVYAVFPSPPTRNLCPAPVYPPPLSLSLCLISRTQSFGPYKGFCLSGQQSPPPMAYLGVFFLLVLNAFLILKDNHKPESVCESPSDSGIAIPFHFISINNKLFMTSYMYT